MEKFNCQCVMPNIDEIGENIPQRLEIETSVHHIILSSLGISVKTLSIAVK